MVELQPSKLTARVRFPLPAPQKAIFYSFKRIGYSFFYNLQNSQHVITFGRRNKSRYFKGIDPLINEKEL